MTQHWYMDEEHAQQDDDDDAERLMARNTSDLAQLSELMEQLAEDDTDARVRDLLQQGDAEDDGDDGLALHEALVQRLAERYAKAEQKTLMQMPVAQRMETYMRAARALAQQDNAGGE